MFTPSSMAAVRMIAASNHADEPRSETGDAHMNTQAERHPVRRAALAAALLAGTSLGGFAPSCEEFTRKARELVGVPYSLWRVRHFLSEPLQAMLQDSSPTGVFCTDVVAYCIDWRLVDYIVKFTLATHPDNQAMAGTGADGKPFFTPNALALALGLLPGKKIQTTGQELSPIFICSDASS